MKKIIVNVPMIEEERNAGQKAQEAYQEKLKAWQEEHDVIARTLYKNKCQINDISYLEDVVRNYILPYKVKQEYPLHDLDVGRRKFGEHTYQLWITKWEHFPVGIVEAAFHNKNEATVKVMIGSFTPSFEEYYQPSLKMLKGLAEEFKKLYGSGESDTEGQMPKEEDLDEKNGVKMEFDLIFKGTPAQFGAMMMVAENSIRAKYEREQRPFFNIETRPSNRSPLPIPSDANPLQVWFIWPDMPRKGRCYIVAHSLPDNKSLLKVTAEDEYWPRLSVLWEKLHHEMVQQGWVESQRETNNGKGLSKYRGRNTLKESDPEDFIYRLAKAQEGEEIYLANKGKNFTWSKVCKQINWRLGSDKSAVKLLYYARLELDWLEKSDPNGWLEKVSEFRAKKEKKIND